MTAEVFAEISKSANSGTGNSFKRVSKEEIAQWEIDNSIELPVQLKEFYLQVGHGFLNVDRLGNKQNDYPNNWVSLDRLTEFWKRTELSFQIDNEIVDEGELPFFDMGSFAYLVLRPNSPTPNAVFRPYEGQPICASIYDFTERLFEDTTFYTKIPV